jgi:hypothetical protein
MSANPGLKLNILSSCLCICALFMQKNAEKLGKVKYKTTARHNVAHFSLYNSSKTQLIQRDWLWDQWVVRQSCYRPLIQEPIKMLHFADGPPCHVVNRRNNNGPRIDLGALSINTARPVRTPKLLEGTQNVWASDVSDRKC